MKPYIFTERGGIHVIDLEKTVVQLKRVLDFIKATVARGGTILFVGTKKQGQEILSRGADEAQMPKVIERWIGGLFTNFANVSKLIKKYKGLLEKKESGALEKYTKKERVEFDKEIDKLSRLVGGLTKLTKIPDAVFILDVRREKTAITEARKRGVPIIAFCDSNINPDLVDYPIPANDDAVKSIEIITGVVVAAILEGQAEKQAINNK